MRRNHERNCVVAPLTTLFGQSPPKPTLFVSGLSGLDWLLAAEQLTRAGAKEQIGLVQASSANLLAWLDGPLTVSAAQVDDFLWKFLWQHNARIQLAEPRREYGLSARHWVRSRYKEALPWTEQFQRLLSKNQTRRQALSLAERHPGIASAVPVETRRLLRASEEVGLRLISSDISEHNGRWYRGEELLSDHALRVNHIVRSQKSLAYLGEIFHDGTWHPVQMRHSAKAAPSGQLRPLLLNLGLTPGKLMSSMDVKRHGGPIDIALRLRPPPATSYELYGDGWESSTGILWLANFGLHAEKGIIRRHIQVPRKKWRYDDCREPVLSDRLRDELSNNNRASRAIWACVLAQLYNELAPVRDWPPLQPIFMGPGRDDASAISRILRSNRGYRWRKRRSAAIALLHAGGYVAVDAPYGFWQRPEGLENLVPAYLAWLIISEKWQLPPEEEPFLALLESLCSWFRVQGGDSAPLRACAASVWLGARQVSDASLCAALYALILPLLRYPRAKVRSEGEYRVFNIHYLWERLHGTSKLLSDMLGAAADLGRGYRKKKEFYLDWSQFDLPTEPAPLRR